MPPVETTNAGRTCRVARSVYGKGTLTTSPCLKLGISFVVCLGVPFAESAEGVIFDLVVLRLREDHAIAIDLIDEFIAFFESQSGTNGSGNCRLRFGGQATRNHDLPPVRIFLTVRNYLTKV